jgi:lysophospholipase L1-like esterase
MARIAPRFWLWTVPLAVGLGAAAVFAAGFVLALKGSIGEPIGQAPPAPREPTPSRSHAGPYRLLVLGDSLAKGTGDEAGKGFALDVLDSLRKKGPAEITNLAVNGMESPEVLALIATPNVRALAAAADRILVSVGANDLSHAVAGRPGSAVEVATAVAAARTRYAQNLRAILSELRAANPAAPIVVLGLYDPFGEDPATARLGAEVILQWNGVIGATALSFPNVVVVPTFDLFQGRPDRLSPDRYHPNRDGYARIAERILQVAVR